jgi:hypothetical protein
MIRGPWTWNYSYGSVPRDYSSIPRAKSRANITRTSVSRDSPRPTSLYRAILRDYSVKPGDSPENLIFGTGDYCQRWGRVYRTFTYSYIN